MTYAFDRSKPFYPIVMTYVISLHGMKELAAVGASGIERLWKIVDQEASYRDVTELRLQMQKLLGPLELEVTGDAERLMLPVELSAKELVENSEYLFGQCVKSALTMLVAAHEVTKDKPYRDLGEKWEFLRHCRHAAAHNGCFTFRGDEPKRPAKWRTIELSNALHGQPLLVQRDGSGHLHLGDPIALLWELERDYPDMAF